MFSREEEEPVRVAKDNIVVCDAEASESSPFESVSRTSEH